MMFKTCVLTLCVLFSVLSRALPEPVSESVPQPTPQAKAQTDSKFNSPLQQHYKDALKTVVSVLKKSIESKQHPMTQRADMAYTQYENSSVAGAFFKTIKDQTNQSNTDTAGVLLLFISSSMPERVIKGYLAQAERFNSRIMVVLRGTIDDSLKLLPTIEYIKQIKAFDGCGQVLCQRSVNTVIDPRLFAQFRITRVPALAYSAEFSHVGYFDNQALPEPAEHTIVVGAATLSFLVKTLSEEINDESLTAFTQTHVF
jgi:type-F conjugative transfer system pilin assembly protein TrbC